MKIYKFVRELRDSISYILNDNTFRYSIIFTFLIGIIAHSYAFLNLTISGDSLVEFYTNKDVIIHKISLGRFLSPVYSLITGGKIVLPWTLGLASLLWIGVSVYLVNHIFSVVNKFSIFVVAGLMTVNECTSALFSTYIQDSGPDTFALLCSTLASYCWITAQKKNVWYMNILGIIFLFISLALYQAYINVSLSILILYSIKSLIDERKEPSRILQEGFSWIILICASVFLYYISVLGIKSVTHSYYPTDNYNSIEQSYSILSELIPRITNTYSSFLMHVICSDNSIWPNWILLIIKCGWLCLTIGSLLVILKNKTKNRITYRKYLLILFLILIIPLGANLTHFLSGSSHDLMHFSFYMLFCSPIFFFPQNSQWIPKCLHNESFFVKAILILLLFSNIQTANALYVKKDLEREHALFEITKIISDIEHTPGYQPGNTPVAFVGRLPGYCVPGTNRICSILGSNMYTPIDSYGSLRSYFRTFLQYDINLCSDSVINTIAGSDIAQQSPVYPNANSIFYYEDILVVNLEHLKNGDIMNW